jgi:hypothetical protein
VYGPPHTHPCIRGTLVNHDCAAIGGCPPGTDPMTPHIPLTAAAYLDDFAPRFWSISSGDSWKLERRQSFREDNSASYHAWKAGQRDSAVALLDHRPWLVEHYQRIQEAGFTAYRVRVVQRPVSDYLQWELRSLVRRAALGERIRVVTAEQVAHLEADGQPLPEIITLGHDLLYCVAYTDGGALAGAARVAEPETVARWRATIAELHEAGRDVADFVAEHAAGLGDPQP